MNGAHEHSDKFIQELRRGTITIAVLSLLSEPQYGYSLVTMLNEKNVQVEPGTLYPLLRRLEKQGLLQSEWDTNESRPRKYYFLSDDGKDVYSLLVNEWIHIVSSLNDLIKTKGEDTDGDD